MTTDQIIENMKVRRDRNRHDYNLRIKKRIRAIQKKMVEISFLPKPDLEQHKQLMNELKVAKMKLL